MPSSPHSSSPKPKLQSTADLARYIGLARTTVSRVLNGQPGLKPKTVERVQRAIAETGFIPNAYPMLMRKQARTGTIGICVENLLKPSVVAKLSALQHRLRAAGMTSLIEVFTPGSLEKLVRHFLSMRAEAVVFLGYYPAEELQARVHELNRHGTPHLVFDSLGLDGATVVTLDRRRSMIDATEHLLSLGHRRFGMLDTATIQPHRFEGIVTALAAAGLEYAQCVVPPASYPAREHDMTYGGELALAFLKRSDPPTAYLALNDEIAIGALHAFQDAGLSVPSEASIVGFNNQDICGACRPTLTSVDQQVDAMTDAATEEILFQLKKGPRKRPLVHQIKPLLVVRGSTGKVAKGR